MLQGPTRTSASTLQRPLPAPSLPPTPHPGAPAETRCRARVLPKFYDLVLQSKVPAYHHGPATSNSPALVSDVLTPRKFYLNARPGHFSKSWYEVRSSLSLPLQRREEDHEAQAGQQPRHSPSV